MLNLYNYPTVIPGKHMTVKHPMLECVPNRTQKTMVSRAYLTILSPHLSNDPHTQSVINSTRNMPASTICWASNNIFSMCTHTLACTHTHISLDLPCCGKPTHRVQQNFLPHTINVEIVRTYSVGVVSDLYTNNSSVTESVACYIMLNSRITCSEQDITRSVSIWSSRARVLCSNGSCA